MRNIIYPFKLGSRSARTLQEQLRDNTGLRTLRVRPDGRYRYRRGDRIINWGNSQIPQWISNEAGEAMLNKPLNVRVAANKLSCFRALFSSEIPVVPFTTDIGEAARMAPFYARHRLTAHSGEGIEYVGYGAYIPRAPLYTKAIDNHGEYRVHVFGGEIIDYRKKSRRRGDEPDEGELQVRTLGNGWVYRMGNLRRLERIERLALDTIEALGLDFGAVDIIKDENGDVFVLEVNTAIGMDGSTITNYTNAILNHYA